MEILILVLALVLFTILAFKGISAILMGPLVSLIVVILSGMPIVDSMLGPFMVSTSNYVKNYFFIFFLGALFGAVYEKTGAAKSIALGIVKMSRGRYTASIITIITGILTLGGISGFVAFFVVYPIALQLFRESNITRRILPGAISAGTWTFSMIAPGSPSIQNVIGIKSLGTTATAAFVPGMIAAAFEFVMIILWLEYRTRSTKKKGMFFDDDTLTPLPAEEIEVEKGSTPNFWLALVPILFIILSFNLFPQVFNVEAAVFVGLLMSIAFFFKYLPGVGLNRLIKPLNMGGNNGVSAIMNTALVVGFGGIVQNTQAFKTLVDSVLKLNMNPLVFVAVSVAICAGAVGSASGGMTIAFNALKDTFISLGVNLQYVHRIGVIAAGTLDTLPHQGAQITLLNLCHLNHREGYWDIFVTQLLIPILTLFVVIPLMMMGL